MKNTVAVLIVGGFLASLGVAVAAQATRSTNEGVYTADQAKKGEATYKEQCAACHGDNLEGSGPMPPLAGKDLPSFRYPLGKMATKTFDGGTAKEANVEGFPVSDKLAGVYMTLKAGALPVRDLLLGEGILAKLAGHPAHLHIDLLPHWQGKGWGRGLISAFLAGLRDAGVARVHLGMAAANVDARAFYDRLGFTEIPVPGADTVTYLGRSTAE